MAQQFTGEYVLEKEMASVGNMVAELGHYKDGNKVYDSKIYIFQLYTKRDGSEGKQNLGKLPMTDETKELIKQLAKEMN